MAHRCIVRLQPVLIWTHAKNCMHAFERNWSEWSWELIRRFFLNMFLDYIYSLRLRDINVRVSHPHPVGINLYCLVNRETRALETCPEQLFRKSVVSGRELNRSPPVLRPSFDHTAILYTPSSSKVPVNRESWTRMSLQARIKLRKRVTTRDIILAKTFRNLYDFFPTWS